ncbi:glycosyltransferase family 4 protein [Pollutimonas sp. M17]|uniref:glycosyltransferase family 4 protein n=1 Tax=Pollutimonas sp. M17 TaxID=2962065 RepID=UPI0021F4B19F|nr:glycosyltransferase family 4 protein [Pollutimonas sp. M17]UYO92575.1 glycosyltransferase family 4 protein [Pollutimonas sp. M17]HWK69732.1 glycosyltransferase family 4 protein [Burkholderiaceae bacterium]
MTPLRILHSEAATSFGGQEQYIYRMMLAMRDRGHHLEAVCQPHAMLTQRLREQGFTVHTTYMDGPVNFVKSVAAIRKILRGGRFDVLNTHSRRDTIVAGCAGRLAGTPLIVRTRHLANRVGSLLSYTVIPHRVTTASDFVREHLIERGVPPGHVATVYPAVELPPIPGQSSLRQELGLAEGDIVVGCVAVMRAQKGHKDLIDAMEPLIHEKPGLHLVLVGGGSPVFEEVQAYVAEKKLQRRIHLLGARRDVPNLLAGFDVFALATRKEASGTVFVEAGAAGLPVVGTRVDGVPEMMRDGVSGLLVPLDDRAALTQAIRRLVDDPDLRRRMGRAGLEFCREQGRFSLAAMVERIESCYTRWLAERKS